MICEISYMEAMTRSGAIPGGEYSEG